MKEIDEETLTSQFQSRRHIYDQLRTEALFITEKGLEAAGIKIHSISSRIKTLESFIGKAKVKELKDPLNDVHDIVGMRVVCLFLSDIDRIGDLIRQRFSVITEDNKIAGTDASSFGYLSLHFDLMMKKEHQGPRYDQISGLPFEIQVRTIAMDAWANISHYLSYKSDKAIPSELRRDFYALSGLFYLADKHFEMFYDTSKNSQERMVELFAEANEEKKAEQEINLDSLRAYLSSKFPDRERSDTSGISELVDELLTAGFKLIGDVDRMLDSSAEAFVRCEKEYLLIADGLTDVGVVRISAVIANDEFLKVYVRKNHGLPEEEQLKFIECRKYLK